MSNLKNVFKLMVCSMPLKLKYVAAKMVTHLKKEKIAAINSINNYYDKEFFELNSEEYKKNIKKYLELSDLSVERTEEFLDFLYSDELSLLCTGTAEVGKPYIICVVRNEADKLSHFFDHYNAVGDFNYVFIDNGSTDNSVNLMEKNNSTVYLAKSQFTTQRKLCWINKVYSRIPKDSWVLLLDADELLVYDGYENNSLNDVIDTLDENNITICGAVMIDMFSHKSVPTSEYFDNYAYFENSFHEEKSYYFKSVYGGIREREFNPGGDRTFLLKKHPLTKKIKNTLLISCHYIFPFDRNLSSELYFGLLHYKLFDSEIDKYKKIAQSGNYGKGGGSSEYKAYVNSILNKPYEAIFKIDANTVRYQGTTSLMEIKCIKDIRTL